MVSRCYMTSRQAASEVCEIVAVRNLAPSGDEGTGLRHFERFGAPGT